MATILSGKISEKLPGINLFVKLSGYLSECKLYGINQSVKLSGY